jgi:hypothetical protein
MSRFFLACVLLIFPALALAADGPLPAPPETGDMQSLFNGKDLTGWDGDPRLWTVKDGVLRGETTEQNAAKGNTFIIWKGGTVKDFELRLSFRMNAANNSGIQYRSRHITDNTARNEWVVRGYQHELRNENKLPSVSGFIYDEGGRRGRICLVGEQAVWHAEGKKLATEAKKDDAKGKKDAAESHKEVTATLIDQAEFEKLFKLDDWNDVIIVARGNRIQHFLNNRHILDFTDSDPQLALKEGIVALQLHAGRPMWVEFKNVRVKELK